MFHIIVAHKIKIYFTFNRFLSENRALELYGIAGEATDKSTIRAENIELRAG